MCPIYSRAWRAGMSSLQLINSVPSSASTADEMTALMVLAIVNTNPLLGRNSVSLDIKKFPPDLLLYIFWEKYNAFLWPTRTISPACYVIMSYGWVAA